MKTYLCTDTHFNHNKIKTYCQRPENFTELIIKNWQNIVTDEDLVIHLGDVIIGKRQDLKGIMDQLPGRKVLVLGNHDHDKSATWFMSNGFDVACKAMVYRGCWLTHKPSGELPKGCIINIHGHLHNFMEKTPEERVQANHGVYTPKPYHRLLAIEYTDYKPVEFDKFVSHPKKYKADIYDWINK